MPQARLHLECRTRGEAVQRSPRTAAINNTWPSGGGACGEAIQALCCPRPRTRRKAVVRPRALAETTTSSPQIFSAPTQPHSPRATARARGTFKRARDQRLRLSAPLRFSQLPLSPWRLLCPRSHRVSAA